MSVTATASCRLCANSVTSEAAAAGFPTVQGDASIAATRWSRAGSTTSRRGGTTAARSSSRTLDRSRFLARLGLVAARYEWLVFGYCLMTNHAHLLVQVPEAGLSEGMRELLGEYACWWNCEHGHYGHLFRNRFTPRRCAPSAI